MLFCLVRGNCVHGVFRVHLQYKAEPSSKEWRTHLDQSVKHDKLITDTFPDTKVQLDRIGHQVCCTAGC